MIDIVERAKAALDGVTDGPWEWFYGDQCCGGTCVDNDHGLPLHSGGDLLPNDARFIAAARTLVPELVAEVEELRAVVSADDSTAARIHRQWTQSRRQVKELRAEVERLRQQIANRTEWDPSWGSPYDVLGDV